MFYYGLNVWASNRFSPEDHDLHFDLGFAGCILSTLAVVSDSTVDSIQISECITALFEYVPLQTGLCTYFLQQLKTV